MSHFLIPLVRAQQRCGVQNARTGTWVVEELDSALDSRARKKGLLGRDGLAPDRGLVIAPTQAVHTFGMRFPLDIVAVSRDGRVVKCRAHVPRGRIVMALRAFAFIELAPGTIERAGLREGDRLTIAVSPQSHLPG